MSILTLILLASFLFSQQPQESPELKEATDLTNSAIALFQERKYDEALAKAKKGLAASKILSARRHITYAA